MKNTAVKKRDKKYPNVLVKISKTLPIITTNFAKKCCFYHRHPRMKKNEMFLSVQQVTMLEINCRFHSLLKDSLDFLV